MRNALLCGWEQPRHLKVEHKGQPLQVFAILWLIGVGPAQVLQGRGEVAELDESLSTENIELNLKKAKRPRLLCPFYHLPLGARRVTVVAPQGLKEFDGPGRKSLAGVREELPVATVTQSPLTWSGFRWRAREK